jgi:Plavaka transposase
MKEFGVPPPPDVITHCRRELCHAVIELILKGQFAEAYRHGILIRFPDGITRRVFPRFYCYSADYPEKSVQSCKPHPTNC